MYNSLKDQSTKWSTIHGGLMTAWSTNDLQNDVQFTEGWSTNGEGTELQNDVQLQEGLIYKWESQCINASGDDVQITGNLAHLLITGN